MPCACCIMQKWRPPAWAGCMEIQSCLWCRLGRRLKAMRRSLILLQLEDMILIVSVDVSITAVYLIHQWLKLLDLRINVVARMVPPISKYKIAWFITVYEKALFSVAIASK
jgi:hypothetical protein